MVRMGGIDFRLHQSFVCRGKKDCSEKKKKKAKNLVRNDQQILANF